MQSFGIWRSVGLVKTDVSEERIASIFRVDKICAREEKVLGGGDTFFRNVGFYKTHAAPHPIRWHSSVLMKFFDLEYRSPT
jgi:hypothetical protein